MTGDQLERQGKQEQEEEERKEQERKQSDGGAALKLDWLTVTFPAGHRDCVEQQVMQHLGTPSYPGFGINSYHESARWPSGAILAWSEGRKECCLILNGDSLDLIPPANQLELLRLLNDLGARGTRVDCAFDDYERLAVMSDVHAAARTGKFTGFRIEQAHEPGRHRDGRRELLGDGHNFGKRGKEGGGAFFQVYDKLLETRAKGEAEIDAIRYEVRFSKDKAHVAFEMLAAAGDLNELADVVGRLVGGAIDFVERGTHQHVARMKRLPWWHLILERIGAARIKVDRVKPPLAKTLLHVGKQYLATFAKGAAAVGKLGGDIFQLLDDAARSYVRERGEPSLSEVDCRLDLSRLFTLEAVFDHRQRLRVAG